MGDVIGFPISRAAHPHHVRQRRLARLQSHERALIVQMIRTEHSSHFSVRMLPLRSPDEHRIEKRFIEANDAVTYARNLCEQMPNTFRFVVDETEDVWGVTA